MTQKRFKTFRITRSLRSRVIASRVRGKSIKFSPRLRLLPRPHPPPRSPPTPARFRRDNRPH